MNMQITCQLVHFLTPDGIRLPGLMYEPEKRNKTAVIYLHGNGSASIMYKPIMNRWGEQLAAAGIAFFPFNNRGAHYIKSLRRYGKTSPPEGERCTYGTAYERIEEAIDDIRGAKEFLKDRGYRHFFLIGESTGANKAVLYEYQEYDPEVTGLMLVSGGDDTGLFYKALGEARWKNQLARARTLVTGGKSMRLVPTYVSHTPLSYGSFLDVADPDGAYNIFPFYETLHGLSLTCAKKPFQELSGIQKPMLIIYGAQDEFCHDDVPGCLRQIKRALRAHPNVTYHIFDEVGHGLDGKEEELVTLGTSWIISNLHSRQS